MLPAYYYTKKAGTDLFICTRPVIFAVADHVSLTTKQTKETRQRHVSTGGDLLYRHGVGIGWFSILYTASIYHNKSYMSSIIFNYFTTESTEGEGGKLTTKIV